MYVRREIPRSEVARGLGCAIRCRSGARLPLLDPEPGRSVGAARRGRSIWPLVCVFPLDIDAGQADNITNMTIFGAHRRTDHLFEVVDLPRRTSGEFHSVSSRRAMWLGSPGGTEDADDRRRRE
jgi:hypothetical protein